MCRRPEHHAEQVVGTGTDDLYGRTLKVLVMAQVLSGAGLAAGVTAGPLLAEDMIGGSGYGGVPAALFTIGSAGAALGVGRLSQRSGRRPGLAVGYAVGAVGGAGVVLAAAVGSVALLLLSLVLYGSGVATSLQARYAGADLAPADQRGRAVSIVLVATTAGAVIGPNLVSPTGNLAAALGVRELAGPFLLATAAYGLAALAIHVLLRPDPLLTARVRSQATVAHDGREVSEPLEVGARVLLAATAMVLTQLVMVAVMTMTPVHMSDHGHTVDAVGVVISVHVAAMFLPSPLTGRLVDRVGHETMLAASGVILLLAGVLAGAAPGSSMWMLTVALGLLGLGWNLGIVAGTAMVTDAVPIQGRARIQGAIDLGVALSGATGGMLSGFVVAGAGYGALGIAGGVLGLLLLPLLASQRRSAPTRLS